MRLFEAVSFVVLVTVSQLDGTVSFTNTVKPHWPVQTVQHCQQIADMVDADVNKVFTAQKSELRQKSKCQEA